MFADQGPQLSSIIWIEASNSRSNLSNIFSYLLNKMLKSILSLSIFAVIATAVNIPNIINPISTLSTNSTPSVIPSTTNVVGTTTVLAAEVSVIHRVYLPTFKLTPDPSVCLPQKDPGKTPNPIQKLDCICDHYHDGCKNQHHGESGGCHKLGGTLLGARCSDRLSKICVSYLGAY